MLLVCFSLAAGAQDAKPDAPKPAEPQKTEVDSLRQQVKDLTLQNEAAQIQLLTAQMQQINQAYNAIVQKIEAENPGMTWNAQLGHLIPKTAPVAPKPATPAPTPQKPAAPAPAK